MVHAYKFLYDSQRNMLAIFFGVYMECKKCSEDKASTEFYPMDKTCKECRKAAVRLNRLNKIDYYREYDKNRNSDEDRRTARRQYQKTEAGKTAHAKATRKYIEQYPMKRAAHIIVGNAIRDGRLKKPEAYESCGSCDKIEAHHDNYTLPFDVRWLCESCHKQWHLDNEPYYGATDIQ